MDVYNGLGITIGASAPRKYTEEELLELINRGYEEQEEGGEDEGMSVDDIDVSSMSEEDKYDLIKEIFDSQDDDDAAMALCKKVKKMSKSLIS